MAADTSRAIEIRKAGRFSILSAFDVINLRIVYPQELRNQVVLSGI